MVGDEAEAEEDEAAAEERYQRESAAIKLQKVCRGHLSRRKAVFIPIWPMLPCPLKGILGFAFGDPINISEELRAVDFKDQIDRLDDVLNHGNVTISSSDDFTRVWHLVQFSTRLGYAYSFQGLMAPASFLWSSVLQICRMPDVRSYCPANATDATIKRNLQAHELLALGHQSLESYKTGDFDTALELNADAAKLCTAQGADFAVVLMIFRAQQAILDCAKGLHRHALEKYTTLVQDILEFCQNLFKIRKMEPPVSRSDQKGPSSMSRVGVLGPKIVCGHLLALCWHNIAVQFAYLERIEESHRATAKSLSMLSSIHASQPVQRHILNAYVASFQKSLCTFNYYDMHLLSERKDPGGRSNARGRESTANISRQWLSIATHCAELAPIWLDVKTYKSVGLISVLESKDGENNAMDLCKLAEKISSDNNNEDADQICQQLQSTLQGQNHGQLGVYILSCCAKYLILAKKNFWSAKDNIEKALNHCEDDFTRCLLEIQAGACLFLLGDHQRAFEHAKAALQKFQSQSFAKEVPADVLTAACQIMALTHIFRGQGSHAFKLAQIAKDQLPLCTFYDTSSSRVNAILRTYEVALAMKDVSESIALKSKHKKTLKVQGHPGLSQNLSRTHSSDRYASPVIPRLSPVSFVPTILFKKLSDDHTHPKDVIDEAVINGAKQQSQNESTRPAAHRFTETKFLWTGMHSLGNESTLEEWSSDPNLEVPANRQASLSTSDRDRGFTRRVLRDWGPDPTTKLRELSKGWSDAILHPPKSNRSPAVLLSRNQVDTRQQAGGLIVPTRVASLNMPRSASDLVWRARTGKHAPLQRTIERSKLGAFLCPLQRKTLLNGMQALRASKRANESMT